MIDGRESIASHHPDLAVDGEKPARADPALKPQPVVYARNLTKRFNGQSVVRGIDFEIQPGQCFGFLGPNGAGKTTTLRMILGLSPISTGRLEVFGASMPDQGRKVRARIGVVPQTDNLDPDFSVYENLRVYGSYFGLSPRFLDARIEALLGFMELSNRARDKTEALSGGMKRRLAVARALINDPDLMILDEPTTGLDPQVRHLLWTRLRSLVGQGKTLVLTTHYLEEAERLCEELIIMDHGRILDRGSPRDLTQKHVEPQVIEIHAQAVGLSESLSTRFDCRLETVGDSLYCYTNDARPVIEQLEVMPELVYLHRPAHLEDVFLRLTGRELRD